VTTKRKRRENLIDVAHKRQKADRKVRSTQNNRMLQFNIMMKLFAMLLGKEFEKLLVHKMVSEIMQAGGCQFSTIVSGI
jgi:hypothetical protein